jgi:hypothetical protein
MVMTIPSSRVVVVSLVAIMVVAVPSTVLISITIALMVSIQNPPFPPSSE